MAFWNRSSQQTGEIPKPARSAAPTATPVAARKPVTKPEAKPLELENSKTDAGKKGFDPYNSGVFDRKDAWGKVIRK